MRLIDADHFLKTLNSVAEKNNSELWKKIAKTMTFMVETECIFSEVSQPKRGKWIYSDGEPATIGESYSVVCTACKEWSEYCTPFCPNCGADMRGEKENENNIQRIVHNS